KPPGIEALALSPRMGDFTRNYLHSALITLRRTLVIQLMSQGALCAGRKVWTHALKADCRRRSDNEGKPTVAANIALDLGNKAVEREAPRLSGAPYDIGQCGR